jgi:hypothetical protein
MRAIMADNDIQGQMRVVVLLLNSAGWRDLWLSLNLAVRTFADLSLDSDVPDAELWHACQREGIVLITGNRNKESPDSLEATIEICNVPTSLPVFTLSDPNRILRSREYANKVVEKLLQYLMEFDNVRGSGRVWLP